MIKKKKPITEAKASILPTSNRNLPPEPRSLDSAFPKASQTPSGDTKQSIKPKSDQGLKSTVREGTDVQVMRDAETGKLTGINIPGRPTLLNLPPEEVQRLAEKAVMQRTLPQGTVDAETAAKAQGQVMRGKQFLEQNPSGVPNPTLNELNPTPNETGGVVPASKIPLIGASLNVMARLAMVTNRGREYKKLSELSQGGGEDPELTEAISKELYKEVELMNIEKDRTLNDDVNALIEAIPLVGGALNKWAGEFIGTPGDSVRTYRDHINKEVSLARDILRDIKSGNKDPIQGRLEIEAIYDRIEALDNKIEVAVRYSATLQANPENIDLIETEILRQKNRIKAASLASERVVIGDYTALDSYLDAESALKGVEE